MEYILVEEDTYRVGELKLKHKRLSLADAIVATTALTTSSTIVSTDMDFEEIPKIALRKIDFA
jgi:predicted nucleic acid-binding protein